MSKHITAWRTSTRSQGQGTCVEVGFAADVVGVRDTKDRDAGHLAIASSRWSDFVAAIKHDTYQR